MTLESGLTLAQEDVLYDWVYSILNPYGVNVAWAYPDEYQQTKPFCILNVPVKPRMEHKPRIRYSSVDTIEYRFHNAFTFSVKIYDDSGNDYIRRVVRSQYYDSIVNLLKTEGLACRYETRPYFLPKIVSDRYEFREGIDFIIASSEADTEITGEIRSVELTGTLQNTIDQIDIIINWTINS